VIPIPVEDRRIWAAWLRESDAAGRFLTGVSNAVSPTLGHALSEKAAAEMMAALRRNALDSPEHLIDALDLVCGDHPEFIAAEIVPALRVLRPDWTRNSTVASALGSGAVRWPETLVGRRSRRLQPHELVVVRRRRDAETAELRAIGAYLADLAEAGAALIGLVGTNRAHVRLHDLTRTASDLLRGEPFGGRVPTLRPGDAEILRSSRSTAPRRSMERLRARDRMKAAGKRGVLTAAFMALTANWLEPIVDDALFELLVLARVLDLIEHRLGYGAPSRVGLLFEGNGRVARFEAGPRWLDVHFDRAPAPIFGGSSRYSGVRKTHSGITLADRRPDITISWSDGHVRKGMLVEMKCSIDATYIRRSIYKAFGYAWDLDEIVPFASSSAGIAVVFPVSAGILPTGESDARVGLWNESADSLLQALVAGGVPDLST